MPTNFLSSPCISLLILLLVMRAYICVVSILVCPNILLTVSMGTPLASVVVVANVCLARCFTEELTRRIVSLQPVEFKGRLYSKEYKEKFRTEHSTATVERNPQEKGKFRLCIDGIPILDWFRKKFQEIKEKLGLNTPVENKQRKGLKI